MSILPFSWSFSGIAHRAGPSPHVKPVEVGRHLHRRAERPGNRPRPRHSSRGNLCETEEELKDDTLPALEFVYQEAQRYLSTIETQPVKLPDADSAARSLPTDLPENGLERLPRAPNAYLQWNGRRDALVWPTVLSLRHRRNNARRPRRRLAHVDPRSELVQPGSPLPWAPVSRRSASAGCSIYSDLPKSWGGILTTGTTTAHITALAAARSWWAGRHGVDIDADGWNGLPPVPVLTGGYVHSTALKALTVLGMGRRSARVLSADATGSLDLDALRTELAALNGRPAIIIATAGEVNAGHFDPLLAMADLAGEFGAWLHVDASFGLFGALSPRTAHLLEGVETGAVRSSPTVTSG